MRPSTPVIGSPRTRASIRAKKRERKKKLENIEEAQQRLNEATQEKDNKSKTRLKNLTRIVKNMLHELDSAKFTFGDLLLHFFDPALQPGETRWESFWKSNTNFEDMMDLIVGAHNATPSGCKRARHWALKLICRKVSLEARKITANKCLQSRHRVIDQSYVFDYDLESLHGHLESHCPTMLEIVAAFSTSRRQKRAATNPNAKERVITTSMLSLLREYSQYNNYHHQILGLFLFGSGTHRQVFSVLSRLGTVVTYTSLLRGEGRASKRLATDETTANGEASKNIQSKPGRVGLVRELSRCCRESARRNAEDGCGAVVIDNINFVAQVSKQTMGHKDVQENGTCATLYRPPGITADNLNLDELRKGYAEAPPPDITDLDLTPDEYILLNKSNLHTVLSIIIDHGGDEYAKFKKYLEAECPESNEKMPIERTAAYPIPAMNVNEGRVDGIIQVDQLIRKELATPPPVSQPSPSQSNPSNPRLVRLYAGDQLTLAHLRSAIAWKLGSELTEHSLDDIELVPGLFHVEMTAVSMILEQYWNNTANSSLNPGSLRFHNTILGRKPITITNAPPFRTSLDLISVSLYARVLAGLPISAGFSSWDEFTTDLMSTNGVSLGIYEAAWNRLCGVWCILQMNNVTPNSPATSPQGDTVLESAILFNEDALLLRNFVDSVKRGDSGRIITILKVWALSFRSTRHTKYSYELMIFIHKLKHIWTPGLRTAILRSWLVNPSGRARGFHAVDLLQEHMNLLIKTIYKARGSNDSWEWLATSAKSQNLGRVR
ncbi:hypothetical protein V565_141850 [Rhizoctonia solani 123E]|uniref:DUF6589 domain-containing protein n=1 Tax=Rhizoctonia solani 123E TaxID=1423351 RepID=A0A074RRB1_9AGAM|nr:hypothetical protein V565_141850 [Rhizoctonia solani 123E]